MLKETQNKDYNWIIYKITNPKNRIYIGKTVNISNRRNKYSAGFCKGQKALYNSIKKYKWENHKMEIIDTFMGNLRDSESKEMYWIKSYMSCKSKYPTQNGMNLTIGGEGNIGLKQGKKNRDALKKANTGRKRLPETSIKIRETKNKLFKENPYYYSKRQGENHPDCRFKEKDVIKVLENIRNGYIPSFAAKEIGMNSTDICNILYRRSWKHLPENIIPKKEDLNVFGRRSAFNILNKVIDYYS